MAEPRFSVESHDACVVVAVHGELDVTSSRQLDDCLAEAYQQRPDDPRPVGRGLHGHDRTGRIVSHWRRQVEADGMFLLAGARYRYTKALWIKGLADRLPMYDNLDEALHGPPA